jgi:hypothetical protein
MARAICYGKHGRIRQPSRQGQEDQLAALGPVLNAVVAWNPRCLDAALTALRAAGTQVHEEDLARLPPLKAKHLNVLGRYNFLASVPGGGCRGPCATRLIPTRRRRPTSPNGSSPDPTRMPRCRSALRAAR